MEESQRAACEDNDRRLGEARDLSARARTAEWWKANSRDFSAFAVLARKALAVQTISASSVRIFSCVPKVTTTQRSRLNPELVASQLFFVSEIWFDEQRKKKARRHASL